MPHNDFYDVAHANMRLSSTIVRLNGYPVYIQEVKGDWTAEVFYLKTGKVTTLPDIRTLAGLDINPVPLGFCQNEVRCTYLMRMPRRRTKQGLSEDSISTHDGSSNSVRRCRKYAKALHNTIIGNYPTKQAAVTMLGKEWLSVAISRNWGLIRQLGREDFDLIYKYYGIVGRFTNNTLTLNPEYSYLQECLDQEIGNA